MGGNACRGRGYDEQWAGEAGGEEAVGKEAGAEVCGVWG